MLRPTADLDGQHYRGREPATHQQRYLELQWIEPCVAVLGAGLEAEVERTVLLLNGHLHDGFTGRVLWSRLEQSQLSLACLTVRGQGPRQLHKVVLLRSRA